MARMRITVVSHRVNADSYSISSFYIIIFIAHGEAS